MKRLSRFGIIIAAALAVGEFFGVQRETALQAVRDYVPTNNRSQMTRTEANTLIVDAYNANPSSMNAALENFRTIISDKKVALLGNGGAAKAIAFALVDQGNELTIVCRSLEKGEALANRLNGFFQHGIEASEQHPEVLNPVHSVDAVTFEEFPKISRAFDIIINATSVGMTPNEGESPLTADSLHKGQTVCDIVYTPPRTKLLQLAEANGCKTVSGEGMLVHQGLESFKKWFPVETAGKQNKDLTAIMREGMKG